MDVELGQFDTTVNGWDEPTRIEIEKTLRATPDVLHVRLPGESRCLGCDQWSQEDPVKVEKQTGRQLDLPHLRRKASGRFVGRDSPNPQT